MRILFRSVLFVAVVASLFVALNPELRKQFHGYFDSNKKEVLASMTADLLNNGKLLKVLKVRTSEGLALEIYTTERADGVPLLARIFLPDKSDGYFHFNGEATNLALKDLNADGRLEILAPSFDTDMTAHLNVYTYNSITKSFERASPGQFPLDEEQ